jgi:5-methylthioadenosine/S-adenosylhomocysteine deaminase
MKLITGMEILIKHADILQNGGLAKDRDILIEDSRISGIGKIECEAESKIEGRGLLAMPGLINMHTHLGLTMARGLFDDLSMEDFLKQTEIFDRRNSEESIRKSALIGMAEMIATGTTCFLDFYYSEDIIAEVAEVIGMRCALAWAVLDEDKTTQKGSPIKNCERFLKGKSTDLVTKGVALQGVYACSDETMLKAKEIASNTFLTMHLSESQGEVYSFMKEMGKRPAEHISSLGLADDRLIAVHCVFLTKREIEELKSSTVVHCPSSNLKLANGIAPIPEIIEAGARVTLGTDSAATNNSLNMFTEMRSASLLHKSTHWDPSIMGYETCLRMATQSGAEALGINAGAIEEGKLADIVLVDERSIYPFTPSNLVYCTTQRVDTTIVNGRILYRKGEFNERIERALENHTD